MPTNATFRRFEKASFENATRATSKTAAIPFENTNEKQNGRYATPPPTPPAHVCGMSSLPRARAPRSRAPPYRLPSRPPPACLCPARAACKAATDAIRLRRKAVFCHRPGAAPPRAPCLLLSSEPGRRVQGCVAQRGGLGGPARGPLLVRDPPHPSPFSPRCTCRVQHAQRSVPRHSTVHPEGTCSQVAGWCSLRGGQRAHPRLLRGGGRVGVECRAGRGRGAPVRARCLCCALA